MEKKSIPRMISIKSPTTSKSTLFTTTTTTKNHVTNSKMRLEWESPLKVFKSIGPKLVPFFKTLGMYFVIFVPADRPSMFGMLLKCLPIASLGLFVLLHGISLGDQHTFARRILAGLLFSCIGDAFLVWPAYFVYGLISFGIAQVCYIFAFGFQPENWTLGVIIYGSTSIGLGLIMPGLIMAGETSNMIWIPIYFVLLTTMVWRAMARVQFFEDLWTWTKLCSCFGGIFFAISDSLLGLNRFYAELPYSQVLIMGTYYLAQLGIALSVVNSKAGQVRPDNEDENDDDNDEDGIYRNWNKKDIWNIPGFEPNTIRGSSRRAVDPDEDF